MADLKQFRLQLLAHTGPKRCLFKASLRTIGCTLLVLGIMLPWLEIATAQQEPSSLERREADLKVQKLELEVAKLKEGRGELPGWLNGVLGFLAGVGSAVTSVWVTRKARHGALDQSVHDKRLETYPKFVKATAGLALYFPEGDPPAPIGPKECGAMGRALSKWYFQNGLLLSVEARNAYFRLARALTRASLAEKLRVPIFPKDAEAISKEKVDEYRKELLTEKFNLECVENWRFGDPGPEVENSVLRFKDFVFLQSLSSTLRTKLSDDLRSRRRPS